MVRVAQPGGRVAILEFSKPRHWLFGRLYRLYFRYVLPLVGQLLSRSQESAYRYLPESVLEFPDDEALAAKLRGARPDRRAVRPVHVRHRHPVCWGEAGRSRRTDCRVDGT